MRIWEFALLGVLVSLNRRADSLSCAPPEYRGTTPCEVPKCCESGQLTTEICSDCLTCASGKSEECGGIFEGGQPACAKELSCFTRCGPCKTEATGPTAKGHECVFPFKYNGNTYEKCTKIDSGNKKSWCAYGIEPGTEVPADGNHWGDCDFECPGTDFECDDGQLFNKRGTCVPKMDELLRIARPYAHNFRAGVKNTTPIQKCSALSPYVHKAIKSKRCYCLPPRVGEEKQNGEGCTKKQELLVEEVLVLDPENLPGVNDRTPGPPPPPRKRGWCFLGGVKDPRYYKPEEHCYDDLQWSETEQKFWSTNACDDVPEGGVPQ